MVKDILDSLKDNFAQKVRNPILATIIIIWSFKNWRLIYSLFTFDPKLTQKERLDYIDKYFVDYPFYPILGDCIWYAFVVLFLTYLILGASRLIVDSYEHKLIPFLKKLTDSTGIVERDRYNLVIRELDETREKYISEKEAKLKAQSDREILEKSIVELNLEARKVPELTSSNASLQEINKELQKSVHDSEKIKEYNERLNEDKHQLKLENIRLLEIHEKEIESTVAELKKIKDINNDLEEQVIYFDKENAKLLESVNGAREENNNLQINLDKLLNESASLKNIVEKKDDEIKKLRQFPEQNIKNI